MIDEWVTLRPEIHSVFPSPAHSHIHTVNMPFTFLTPHSPSYRSTFFFPSSNER